MSEISLELGTVKLCAGQRWDDRFIRALLISYVVVPHLGLGKDGKENRHSRRAKKERSRVLEVFTTEVALRFDRAYQSKTKKDGTTYRRLAPLARGDASRVEKLLSALPPDHYFPEWNSGKKAIADVGHLRDFFSVGLFVLILDDLSRSRGNIKLSDGKDALDKRYTTGNMWVTNTNGFPKALTRFRPVAHLAAALVRLLHESKGLSRNRKAFTIWRRHMLEFLSLAKYYEEFLTVKKITGRQSWDRHKSRPRASSPAALYRRQQLWCLPPFEGVTQVERMPALPLSDRKPAAAQSGNRRPSARA